MHLLSLENVSKTYHTRKYLWSPVKKKKAVADVSLKLEMGKCLGLVGESGCGKSTLARLITGLEVPSSGEIKFKNTNIAELQKKGRLDVRKDMQLVFQDCYSSVNPRYTAEKVLLEPLRNFLQLTAGEEKERVEELLELVDLHRDDKHKFSHQFSGGQLQRLCIARALAVMPKMIVLDEPTSSLDVSIQAQILNLLADLKEQFQLSYLLISHDLEAVYYLADALAVMYRGTIVEIIEDIHIFDQLKHPYTKMILDSVTSYASRKNHFFTQTVDRNSYAEDEMKGCVFAHRCDTSSKKCHEEKPELKAVSLNHSIACHSCIQ